MQNVVEHLMKTYLLKGPHRQTVNRLKASGWRRNGKAWIKGRLVARFLSVDNTMLCIQRIPWRKTNSPSYSLKPKSYSPFEDSPEYHERFA